MTLDLLRKLARHHKRLEGMSVGRRIYYVANVLVGETYRKRGLGPLGPRLVEITLTNRCQCRCVHCYNECSPPVDRASELSADEIAGVLDSAARLGFTEVNFTGGEPLMRDDIVDLVGLARSAGLLPKINTNGVLLTEEMLRRLKQAGLSWCAVSIDSAVPAEHDRLRGYEGCFQKAVEGLRGAVWQGIPASITTYARKDALRNGELRRIVDIGHQLGVETVRILFPVPIGGFENADEKVLNHKEREKVRRLLADPLVTMESPREGTSCTAAVTKINILPNGDVTPCVFIPVAYGNIRDENLGAIWARMGEFDKRWKPDGQCPMCNALFRDAMLAHAGPSRK